MRTACFFMIAIMSCQVDAGAAEPARPRIISLYAAHTEVLVRLGARDNIIGVSRQETYSGPETSGWDPPEFSIRDDVEKFIAAAPDLILVRPQHIASAARWKEAMEAAGIAVAARQVTRADDLYGYWRELAALVHKEDRAEAMIARFEEGVAAVRERAANLPFRPKVFVESMHREIKTFTPDSIPMWLVETAGGVNAAADARPVSPGVIIADYGPERLLTRADAIDVFISQRGPMNRAHFSAIRSRDLYQTVRAFRTGNAHSIDEAIFARPTPSLLEGLELLSGWIEAAAN